MKTIDIMTPNPQCVGPEESLTAAAEQMKRLNVGMLPVCRDDRLIGVLTDRDIAVRGVANGLDPKHTKVRTIMSRLIISCFADQDQEAAATIMESHRVRRLPVLDRNEQLIGVISLSDLAFRTGNEELASRVLERHAAHRQQL